MISINERIRLILDREDFPNKAVAKWLGMTNSRLSQKFKAGIWDSVDELKKIAEATGYSLNWIVTGKGMEKDSVLVENIAMVSEPPLENVFLKVNRQIRELDEGKNSPEAEQLNGEIHRLKFENEVLRSALREIGAERNAHLEELDRRMSALEKHMEELTEFRNAYVHMQPLKTKNKTPKK